MASRAPVSSLVWRLESSPRRVWRRFSARRTTHGSFHGPRAGENRGILCAYPSRRDVFELLADSEREGNREGRFNERERDTNRRHLELRPWSCAPTGIGGELQAGEPGILGGSARLIQRLLPLLLRASDLFDLLPLLSLPVRWPAGHWYPFLSPPLLLACLDLGMLCSSVLPVVAW